MPSDERTVYRYGDFPELFWDLDPAVEVDRDDPLIISRVLRQGNLKHVRKLVRMDVLARESDHLELPDHIRGFWALPLERLRQRQPLNLEP